MPRRPQYLKTRGRNWEFCFEVPRDLQARGAFNGRRRWVVSLKTENLPTAEMRKLAELRRCRQLIEAERRKLGISPLVSEALEWREMLREDRKQHPENHEPDGYDALGDHLKDRAEQIEREAGEDKAQAFFQMATGAATPLAHYVDAWLADSSYAGRSATMNRQAIREFGAWLTKVSIPETIERVDRKLAGRFCSEALYGNRGEAQRHTGDRKKSNLSAYWRWLVSRGHADENPWVGQGLRQGRKAANDGDDDQRPYTEAELVKLFGGDPDVTVRDLMLVGALSGMRLDEICRLTVADCADDAFSVRVGKTVNARRIVPVHPLLSEIVQRRSKDALPTAYLFSEFGEPRKDGSRGGAASTRFNRYRRDQGVDDRPNGRRRSRVDFHSFRHWFTTTALRARVEERIVKQVVGHALTGVTLSIYFDGDLEAAKCECVEAVRLPEAVVKLLDQTPLNAEGNSRAEQVMA